MNVFTFTGNIGKAAEVKYLPSGSAVCTFSVAVKSGFGDKQKTTWVKCGMFGKRAEGQLPQYLGTGAHVAISGELTLDEWEKDGQKHSMLKVNVSELTLIKSGAETQQPAQQGGFQPQQAPAQQGFNPNNPPAPPQNQPMGVHQAAPKNGFPQGDDPIPF